MPDNVKPWWLSKTLWFNAVAAALAALEATEKVLQPVLGDKAYPILIVVVAVGNAILRIITTQALVITQARADGGESKP